MQSDFKCINFECIRLRKDLEVVYHGFRKIISDFGLEPLVFSHDVQMATDTGLTILHRIREKLVDEIRF